jgi:nucleoside-diphosphate-sugar epimerase
MNIFITGGSGYIGASVIAALLAAGHEVAALSRSEGSDQVLRARGATPVRGTLTDLDVLRSAAEAADGAIHLAQASGDDPAGQDLAAAQAMLAGLGAGPYVHTGGTWVWGDTDGVADEDAPRDAPALVAWRERSETAVLAAAAGGSRPVLVVPGLVYGDHGGLIEAFLGAAARRGEPVPYVGDGANRWALVHRADLADLYVRALHAAPGATYAATGATAPTAREVAEAVARSAERDGAVVSITLDEARAVLGPIADAFALGQQVSSAKARRELGWTPRHEDPLTEIGSVPAIG